MEVRNDLSVVPVSLDQTATSILRKTTVWLVVEPIELKAVGNKLIAR